MSGLKTLLWTLILESNFADYVADSPKSRYLQKYRLKSSNPEDYNSVYLGCGVFSLDHFTLLTATF